MLVPVMFVGFAVASLALVQSMLAAKRSRRHLERFRLLFFFLACLLLVCLLPLWAYDLLSRGVWITNLTGVAINAIGWLLTLGRQRATPAPPAREPAIPDGIGVRTYTLYFLGAPMGLITKGAFDKLAELGLLKRQRTVELVDDYRQRARELGVRIEKFTNRDGSQTLIKVLVDE